LSRISLKPATAAIDKLQVTGDQRTVHRIVHEFTKNLGKIVTEIKYSGGKRPVIKPLR